MSDGPDPSLPACVPPPRRRPLRSISMLPTLLTLGNLCLGFAALYCCARQLEELGAGRTAAEVLTRNSELLEAIAPSYLAVGVWALLAAMTCDALDGRVARRTGAASAFGVQLDSLADIVSFGVAPAMLMMTMVRREFMQWSGEPLGVHRLAQATALIALIYVCCAALRLARFNVEASLEEAAHRGFRGLPSPGAAGAVGSLVLLHDHLEYLDWMAAANMLTWGLPLLTLAVSLLMVSRVPYPHMVSSFFRHRPFGHVIGIVLVLPPLLLFPEWVLTLAAWTFVLNGPIRRLARRRPGQTPQQVEAAGAAASRDEGAVLRRRA